MRPLIRHFFSGLLRPETAAGEDSYMTWLIQVAAFLIGLSWYVPVKLAGRYAALHANPDPHRYHTVWSSDWLFALTLFGILMSILTLLEWPALFPSRRDFLVLMPLPLTRAQLFLAKVAALFLFVSIFIGSLTVLNAAALPAVSAGRWETHPLAWRILAFLVSSVGLCYFLFFAFIFVQGLLLNLLPLRWFPPVSFGLQVFLLLAMLCALPSFPYLPTGHWIATNSVYLTWLPPCWFWGLGQWLLGEPTTLLAARAGIASAIVLTGAALTYLLAYFRYARFSSEVLRRDRARFIDWPELLCRVFPKPASRATGEFILRTLARGREQKLALLLIAGIGIALVVESGIYLTLFHRPASDIQAAVIELPLTLSFFAMLGLRRAFRTPSELPANWLFSFLEDATTRTRQLDSVFWTFYACGALPLLIACAPIQFAALGAGAWRTIPLEAFLMLILAEYLLRDWRAIPFTFTQNPAQRHVIQSAVLHLAELCAYSFLAGTWILQSLKHARGFLLLTIVLALTYLWMHRRRMRDWGIAKLEFTEHDPEDLQSLRLIGS